MLAHAIRRRGCLASERGRHGALHDRLTRLAAALRHERQRACRAEAALDIARVALGLIVSADDRVECSQDERPVIELDDRPEVGGVLRRSRDPELDELRMVASEKLAADLNRAAASVA
jgi:hypothetical protein